MDLSTGSDMSTALLKSVPSGALNMRLGPAACWPSAMGVSAGSKACWPKLIATLPLQARKNKQGIHSQSLGSSKMAHLVFNCNKEECTHLNSPEGIAMAVLGSENGRSAAPSIYKTIRQTSAMIFIERQVHAICMYTHGNSLYVIKKLIVRDQLTTTTLGSGPTISGFKHRVMSF
jgi:hypothetical protein